jgi:hypothetical protein
MIGSVLNRRAAVALLALGACAAPIVANSNVADPHKFAWAENVGWLNWADANNRTQGVEVYATGGPQYLAGWIWGENIGWINVGNGNAPYANTDNTNFGVNIDPTTGAMRGLAWGENVGWIVFDDLTVPSESPSWDHLQHRSHGYAWGENIGWVNLEDMIRFVCSLPGDVDFDGDVDVFDFGTFAANFTMTGGAPFANGDCDGDGDVDVFDFGLLALNFESACP